MFKEMEGQSKDSYCDINSDADSNLTTMNHSRSMQGLQETL